MSELGEQMIAGLKEIIDNMDEYIDRQQFLIDHSPSCPKCVSSQVWLIKLNEPALWKCRSCSEIFEQEPVKATENTNEIESSQDE